MVGISSYSTYLPRYRLRRASVASAWGTRAAAGAKAVMNFDEDALTMGYMAAWRALGSASADINPDALYFASTTSPYWQRSLASFIAAACDLPPETETADFASSLRAATCALAAAVNAVKSGSNRRVLVVAADAREGAPESDEEQVFADAAAAIVIGDSGVIAELLARVSRSDDFLDEWRRERDAYVNTFASKFSISRGYEAGTVEAGQQLLNKAGVKPQEITRVALFSPDGKAHLGAAKKLGFSPEQVEDIDFAGIGITGAAMPLFLLAQSLNRAKAGDLILVISYGDGADALLFRATDEIDRRPSPLLAKAPRPLEYPSYQIYRKLRDWTKNEEGAQISNVLYEKEEPQNVRLHGTRCSRCGAVQFPRTKVCQNCRSSDGLVEVPLSRRGHIFTFTRDYLYDAPVKPTAIAVIDLEGGGRFQCQMTDVEESEIEIGLAVELTLRRMKEGGSMHHYYWKCRPVE